MRKRLHKLLAVVVLFAIVLTSGMIVASAESKEIDFTLDAVEIVNPTYKAVREKEIGEFSLRPKQYFAATADLDEYIDNHESVGSLIRRALVARTKALTVYFVSDERFSNSTFNEVFEYWSELAFAETQNAYEGDYLRYVYKYMGTLTSSVSFIDGKYYYVIPMVFDYYTTLSQENDFDSELRRVLNSFDFDASSTPRKKSDVIYKYITDNITYDYENLEDENYLLKFTAYAALIDKTAVCQGYATLYYRMARECGLDVRVITGQSYGENHAWNIVKMGDYYYYLDSTWDAGESTYGYYLLGSEEFTLDHTVGDEFLTSEFKAKYPISADNLDLTIDQNENYYTYYTYMDKAYITSYNGSEEDVIVPAKLGGYSVYKIDSGVFYDNNVVKSITISEGVERMGEGAIDSCINLEEINFPSTMQIGYEKYTDDVKGGYTEAPVGCPSLKTINVPYENPYITSWDGVLYSSDFETIILYPAGRNISKVRILSHVENVAPYAFYDCEKIEELTLPDSVKMIGYWAFCNARNLKKVNIPNNCEFIGQFAFANTKLEEINIPGNVHTILGGAFGMETNLKKITVDPDNENFYMNRGALIYHNSEFDTNSIIDYATDNADENYIVPSNILEIDQYAFANAQNLEDVIIFDNVEYIRSYAFENCDALTFFIFPEGMETIEDAVLLDCDNIMSVIIPDSVTEIGNMLVYDNDGYTVYGEKGSEAESYAINNSFKFKETDEFVCETGHTIKVNYTEDCTCYNVCTVCGDRAETVNLIDINLFTEFATTEFESYQYTGLPIEPKIDLFENYDGVALVEGVDYEIVGYFWNENVGNALIEVKGIGAYGGTGYIDFEITPCPLTKSQIEIEYLTTVYDGNEKCPTITIKGLKEFEDYNVEYWNNINPGTARAIITAWGNYEGSVYVEFDIVKRKDGLVQENGVMYYYENGVKSTKTGLVDCQGKKMYINKGCFTGASGLVTINGKKTYINKGYFTGSSGLVTIGGKKAYINKGYFTGSSGLVTIGGKKMYINKGYFTGSSGLVTVSGKKMYISKGYFLGKSGLVTIGGKKAYINKGYFTGSTGIVTINGKKHYINKGYFTGASGKVKVGGKTYTIVKGIVK